MRRLHLAFLFSILFISFDSLADETTEYQENTMSPIAQFAVFEGLMAGMSWLGTTDFAGVFIITHPWALAEALHDKNDTMFYTGVASAEALAIYTLSLDEEKYSKSERFKKNMIAWHVFFGVIGVTDWITGGDGITGMFAHNKDDAVNLAFTPLIDGGRLHANFRF